MATINNNNVYSIVNAALTMSVGAGAVDTIDCRNVVDIGTALANYNISEEQFTKALINVVVKNWFTDSSYRSQYEDPFFQDAEQFGAIVQHISVEVPQVTASSAWADFTATSPRPTLGTYTIYLPVVHTQYYEKTVSWELPICITGEQWDTAFHNESEVIRFVSYILMCVDNALIQHMENMNNINRNNFIVEKYNYANSQGATGIHVVNLTELAYKDGAISLATGESSITTEEYLASASALLNGTKYLRLYKDYMGKMSVLFNTAGRKRFTPKDRLVLQVNSHFDEILNTIAYSDTYHNDIVKAPGFQSVPYWQGEGLDLSWDSVTKIKGIAADATGDSPSATTVSNVVAFMCDKWAIMHTIKSTRVAVKRFEPEDLIQYYYQYRDMFMNDLTMNAIVFVVEDYTPST